MIDALIDFLVLVGGASVGLSMMMATAVLCVLLIGWMAKRVDL